MGVPLDAIKDILGVDKKPPLFASNPFEAQEEFFQSNPATLD